MFHYQKTFDKVYFNVLNQKYLYLSAPLTSINIKSHFMGKTSALVIVK